MDPRDLVAKGDGGGAQRPLQQRGEFRGYWGWVHEDEGTTNEWRAHATEGAQEDEKAAGTEDI